MNFSGSFNLASGGPDELLEVIKLWPSLWNIFQLVEVLVLQKSLKILLCRVSLEVEPGSCSKAALLFPGGSARVSASPPFPD